MDHLPEVLVSKILSRLSINRLMQCRSVCKSWLNIIDDPCFRKSLPLYGEAVSFGFSNGDETTGPIIYTIVREGDEMKAKQLANFPELHGFCGSTCSCSGFLLLERRDATGSHVFESAVVSPFTKEIVIVPESPYQWEILGDQQVLGFEPLTNTYKLVQVTKSNRHGIRAAVYDFESGRWRRCNSPREFIVGEGICVDGTLHWISEGCFGMNIVSSELGDNIVSFDLMDEMFTTIPIPMKLDFLGGWVKLIEMAGSLALFIVTRKVYIDIWMRSRVSEGYAWHHKTQIKASFPGRQLRSIWGVLGVYYHQEKLLIRGINEAVKRKGGEGQEKCFALYDLKDKQFEFCAWDEMPIHLGMYSALPEFVFPLVD